MRFRTAVALAVAGAGVAAFGVATVRPAAAAHPAAEAHPAAAAAHPPVPVAQRHNHAGWAPSIADDQRMRVEFGLRSDRAYVTALEARDHDRTTELGIPLTSAEVSEMHRRGAVGQRLEAVGDAVGARQPATYGGVWLDQAAGGVAVVASTDPASVDRRLVASLLPAGAKIDVRQVAVSYRTLNDLNERIAADMQARPVDGTGVGTFLMDNVVHVDLPATASDADIEAVYARYGRVGLRVDRNGGTLF